MDDLVKGSAAIISATVFWAIGGGVFSRLLSQQSFPMAWSTPFSFLVAGVILFAYSKKKGLKQAPVVDKPLFYCLAFSNAFAVLFAFLSFENTTLGASTFMQLLSIPLAPLAAWFFLREALPKKIFFAMILAGIGLIVLNGMVFSFSSIGLFYAFLSAIASVATLLFARLYKAEFNALLAAYVFLASFVILLPVALAFYTVPQFSFYIVAIILGMGFLDLALGDMLRLYSISKAPVRIVAFLELFQAITFPLAGLIVFNEALSGNVVVGGVLIVASALLALY